MRRIERDVLRSLYVAQLTGAPHREVCKDMRLGAAAVAGAARGLSEAGLVRKDGTPSRKGVDALNIVLAVGVFDIIHPGHIHTLTEARRLGDVLVVAIATDRTAVKMKRRRPLHDQEQRRILVDSLAMVDAAIVGSDSDIFETVARIRPRIIALGYDQTHQEKAILDGCRRIGLPATVARLQSPVPDISSSTIEKKYGKDIHGT